MDDRTRPEGDRSNAEILGAILRKAGRLALREAAGARVELRQDLRAEGLAAGALAVAGLSGVAAFQLGVTAAALVLAERMRPARAALVAAGLCGLVGGGAALVARRAHVRRPLSATRRRLAAEARSIRPPLA